MVDLSNVFSHVINLIDLLFLRNWQKNSTNFFAYSISF